MPPSAYPTPVPVHVVRNCVSLLNSAAGFYENHQPTSDSFYNNSAYNNGDDYNMQGYDLAKGQSTGMGIYRNDVAYGGTLTANATGAEFSAAFNSWDIAGLTIAASDFASLDTAGIMGPRNADGSVPNTEFMRLSATSKLIDAGTYVGLPYSGKAPDLGAFEYNATGVLPSHDGAQSDSKWFSSIRPAIHWLSGCRIIKPANTAQRPSAFSMRRARKSERGDWQGMNFR